MFYESTTNLFSLASGHIVDIQFMIQILS